MREGLKNEYCLQNALISSIFQHEVGTGRVSFPTVESFAYEMTSFPPAREKSWILPTKRPNFQHISTDMWLVRVCLPAWENFAYEIVPFPVYFNWHWGGTGFFFYRKRFEIIGNGRIIGWYFLPSGWPHSFFFKSGKYNRGNCLGVPLLGYGAEQEVNSLQCWEK